MKKILLVYHFFYPDDVVSARHFSDFAVGLKDLGWVVSVLTSNKYCRNPEKTIKQKKEKWNEINIYRISRPQFKQSSNIGRLINSFFICLGCIRFIRKFNDVDVIVFGSDPQFIQLIFPIIKLIKKKVKIAFWCFDLYPEAIAVKYSNKINSVFCKMLQHVLVHCYRKVDLIADIGPCMEQRLNYYKHQAKKCTLTPWALVEPKTILSPDKNERQKIFGDAKLALMYSGTLGNAHQYGIFLKFARAVYKKDPGIVFCFSGKGNKYNDLKKSIKDTDKNIRLEGFADESQLIKRLCVADIHLVSLLEGWEGIVVPSKLFGSMAVGKPVLFAGPKNSSINVWMKKYNFGFFLSNQNLDKTVELVIELANNKERIKNWNRAILRTYHQYFSKQSILDKWNIELKNVLANSN